MKQAEDSLTADLPGLDPALGDIARSLLGLPGTHQVLPPAPPLPAWRAAFEAAIKADPRGKLGIAERLGVSRPYVSRVATGDLKRRPPPNFITRVQALLMQVDCPHLGRALAPAECHSYAQRSYAQVSQFDVHHWRACRGCTHNTRRAGVLAVAAGRGHPLELTATAAVTVTTATTATAATATATATATPGEHHA